MFDNLAIGGVPLLLGIFGLVSFAKSRGMKGNALAWLSFVLGAVAFASVRLMVMYPVIQPWVELVWFALAGPAVSGLYDQGKEWASGAKR